MKIFNKIFIHEIIDYYIIKFNMMIVLIIKIFHLLYSDGDIFYIKINF